MLIVICGATATGKSGLAISIAQRLNSEILSADSRQIYRDFDIATATVSKTELALVPHHFVSTSDPNCTVTVAQYQAEAQPLIDRLQQQRQIPFLVGGTGLYIKSVVKGMKMPRVAADEDLRTIPDARFEHWRFIMSRGELFPVSRANIPLVIRFSKLVWIVSI
jgi:tRNA dimethylallyltransferase